MRSTLNFLHLYNRMLPPSLVSQFALNCKNVVINMQLKYLRLLDTRVYVKYSKTKKSLSISSHTLNAVRNIFITPHIYKTVSCCYFIVEIKLQKTNFSSDSISPIKLDQKMLYLHNNLQSTANLHGAGFYTKCQKALIMSI